MNLHRTEKLQVSQLIISLEVLRRLFVKYIQICNCYFVTEDKHLSEV